MRKLLYTLFPLFLTACISSQPFPSGVIESQPVNPPQVRLPQVGQQWVYNVRNVFNQEVVDVVTETIVSVGQEVRIQRKGEKAGTLPDEIQSPWGFILQDPHWIPAQKFITPIPLWPQELKVGWTKSYETRYEVVGHPDGSLYWGSVLEASRWEKINVPAGNFLTLKYENTAPFFQSNDVFRLGNYRHEDVWLAPEIGRWVILRSYGRYVTGGLVWGDAYWEDYLQWELVSWK